MMLPSYPFCLRMGLRKPMGIWRSNPKDPFWRRCLTTQLQMAIWWKPIWWWLVIWFICKCSVCKYKYFSITYVNVNRFMSFSTHNHGSSVHISGMVIVSVLITETWQKHAPYLAVSPWNFPHCLQGSSLPRRTLVAELENHRIFPTQGGAPNR